MIALCKKLITCFALEKSLTSERKSNPIHLFHVPTINVKADVYYQLANIEIVLNSAQAIPHLINDSAEECRMTPLLLSLPCHNQTVERHVKLVTEASDPSLEVAGFERRDGIVRQKIKSCSFMKKFDTKMYFT